MNTIIFGKMLILKVIILVSYLPAISNITLDSDNNNLFPSQVVAVFYHDYLVSSEIPDMTLADKFLQNLVLKYTTVHLRILRDNDESGSDYFIAAQEICEEWKDSIGTETVYENNRTAQVMLKLGYEKGISLYTVNMVKKKGKWLINSVRLISRSSPYCSMQAEGRNKIG